MVREVCNRCQHFSRENPNPTPKYRYPPGFGRCTQSVNWRFQSPSAPCEFNPPRFLAIPEPPKFALSSG